MNKLVILIVLTFFSLEIYAQQYDDEGLIQFSGNVLTSGKDSLEILPFVLVKNESRNSGSYSGHNGYFSIVAKRGDTVMFSHVGYKKSKLIIPKDIKNNKIFVSQIMIQENQSLPEAIIVPWQNIDELKKAFIDLHLNEDDIVVAYQNMQYSRWKELSQNLPQSNSEAQYNTEVQQRKYENLYTNGVIPANNLLNPVAWYQFINMISNNKKDKKNTVYPDEP